MQSKHKKRICIVSRSLSEGGADRVAAMQSIFLDRLGYDVYLVTVLNSIKYPYKGIVFNLGEFKDKNDSLLGRFNRLLRFKKFLKTHKIDIVIDHRVRCKIFSEYIISAWVYPKSTIYMVHNYTIERYFPPIKWLTKLVYKNAKQIVAVSDNIEAEVKATYNFQHVSTIYNSVDLDYINALKTETIDKDSKFIFWYGRFEEKQKNISLLIEAYHKSILVKNNYTLILMGDGKDKDDIERKIVSLKIEDSIKILPFSTNPFAYINASRFTVLSSRYEGFPMTILESLACDIPVVSVKYKNFDDGIIKHEFNGLLAENNADALAKAMNRFIEDEKLYLSCKSNAQKSIAPYTVTTISNQWKNLIEAQ